MFAWPSLELTEYERKFVRIYRTKDKPGVLNRRYKILLNSQAAPTKNLPTINLAGQIQISRRSRVYALTFSGNLDAWRLNIQNASGTLFTNRSPRGQLDPIVSSLVPGMYHNALSLGGLTPPLTGAVSPGIGPAFGDLLTTTNAIAGQQPFPLLIEPNWLLMPNETLIFTGTPIETTYTIETYTINPMLTLTICAHVWEFPIMGNAPPEVRQVI